PPPPASSPAAMSGPYGLPLALARVHELRGLRVLHLDGLAVDSGLPTRASQPVLGREPEHGVPHDRRAAVGPGEALERQVANALDRTRRHCAVAKGDLG